MSRICPLFSGSTGNSTYIMGSTGSLLVDAGSSLKGITEALSSIDMSIANVSAVLITHEHIDHIKGLKPLLNKTGIPIIASAKTIDALISADKIPSKTKIIEIGDNDLILNDIKINRFATSHDCEGSSGYSFLMPDNKKISICTDLGVVTDEVRAAIIGSDAVLIESNHDIELLKKGPYPPELKVRIMSDKGHISNSACAAELPNLLNSGTKRFILGHLSRNNNTPLLALSAAESVLMDIGAKRNSDYIMTVAAPTNNKVTVV